MEATAKRRRRSRRPGVRRRAALVKTVCTLLRRAWGEGTNVLLRIQGVDHTLLHALVAGELGENAAADRFTLRVRLGPSKDLWAPELRGLVDGECPECRALMNGAS